MTMVESDEKHGSVTTLNSNGACSMEENGSSCMELALQGEQLCKQGDCRGGVEYFEAAIKLGKFSSLESNQLLWEALIFH